MRWITVAITAGIVGGLAGGLGGQEARAQEPTADLIWVDTDGPGSGVGTNTLTGVEVGDLVTLHVVVNGGDLGLTAEQHLTLGYDSTELSGVSADTCPNPPNPSGPSVCDDPVMGGFFLSVQTPVPINEIGPGSTMSPFDVEAALAPSIPFAPLTLGEASFQVAAGGEVRLLYLGPEHVTDAIGQNYFPEASAFIELVPPNTPPVASCVESVNPSGSTTPPAGSTTLPGPNGPPNPDGFYELVGEDAEDGTAPLFVTTASRSAVFGPFSSGLVVEITEAPGAVPTAKNIGGPESAVAAHLILDGDAIVLAVDSEGAESPMVECVVPPPACGIGFELALLLPPLAWLHRRRRHGVA